MKRQYYKVAEQVFAFETADHDERDYLPSFRPFVWEPSTDDTVLYTLTIDDTLRPSKQGETIGEFDCGGADFNVYRNSDGGYQFLIAPPGAPFRGYLEVDALFHQGRLALCGNDWERAFATNNAMMLMFAFSTADKNTLLFHSSVIENDGHGYLFLGKSGTGKSTHSSLWLKHIAGSELMNDDNPVVVAGPEGATVYGSPWSGKTPCYRNVSAPIGAFVRIVQEKVNHIERDDTLRAFASLLPSVSSMKWDDRIYDGICDSITLLIEHVPCYTLGCRPDEEAAQVCYEAVKA